jgi:hypothetical protein
MQGSGITRIDAFLTNPVASHVFKEVKYDYRSGRTFDHVPLNMTLSLDKFEDYTSVAILPAELNLLSLTGMATSERRSTQEERAKRYKEVWMRFANQFRGAIGQDDAEGAHRIWCLT